jgi:hypothetical protein
VQKPSPTFLRVLSTDYLAQNFFVMIFGAWVIYAIDAIFEGRAVFLLAIFAAICTPIGLILFFWRYRLIISTFENGMETSGRVTEISTISTGKKRKDYIIHYEYDLNGQKYQYSNRVKKNTHARMLQQGQQVNLLLHEKTPHIAFIKDIYLEYP